MDRSNIRHHQELEETRKGDEELQQLQDDDENDEEMQERGEHFPLEVLVVNKSKSKVKLYWDDDADGVLVASLDATGGECRIATYKGHSFFSH